MALAMYSPAQLFQMFQRYSLTGRKPHPKVKFTPSEDERLTSLVNRFGDSDWNLISQHMGNRNPRQCRERWTNYLSPTVNSSPWTPEDDRRLQELQAEFGSKWVKISHHFPNRTDTNIKNRWMVLQRQKKYTERHEQMAKANATKSQVMDSVDSVIQETTCDDKFTKETEVAMWEDLMTQTVFADNGLDSFCW